MFKTLILSLFFMSQSCFAFSNLSDQAAWYQELFGNPSSDTQIATQTDYNAGETRPKAALKGAFYFGGSDQYRDLLSSSFKNMLCEDGFSHVYSVYKSVDETVSCSENSYAYTRVREANLHSEQGDRVYRLLKRVYDVIQSDGDLGPVFLHCHYGVHASNVIAQMALMQFCGISREQAQSNWHIIDLYDSLSAERTALQMEKISNFTPYPELQISAAQKAVVCY